MMPIELIPMPPKVRPMQTVKFSYKGKIFTGTIVGKYADGGHACISFIYEFTDEAGTTRRIPKVISVPFDLIQEVNNGT